VAKVEAGSGFVTSVAETTGRVAKVSNVLDTLTGAIKRRGKR
jgi:hypothetical protein